MRIANFIATAFVAMWCTVAVAANAPDTTLLTGPTFQQVPAAQILVTPNGGTQATLGSVLATLGTPGGTSGQIQVNSGGSFGGVGTLGTGSVLLATSPTITTPTISGLLTTLGGISDTSTTQGFSTLGPLTFGGAPLAGGGNGGVTSNVVSYTLPTTGLAIRNRSWNDNITVTGTSGITDEGFALSRTWLGSGTMTAEANGFHVAMTDSATGIYSNFMENFEASTSWSGTHNQAVTFIDKQTVNSTGSFSQGITGFKSSISVANPTAGAQSYRYAFYCDNPSYTNGASVTAFQGDFCLYGADPNGIIGGLGRGLFGIAGIGTSTHEFEIDGQTSDSTTDALYLANHAGTAIFRVRDDGFTLVNGGILLGLNTTNGFLQVANATSGSLTIQPPVGVTLAGTLTWPNTTGTLVATSSAPTFTSAVTMGGGSSLTWSTLPSGTAATYACFTSAGLLVSSATAC